MFITSLIDTNPALYVILVAGVIVSVVLHELGHAYAAEWQGDPTPRMLGHMTLNPVKHMGWLSLALAAVFGFAFGATPVQPRNFRDRRWGDVLVSFAGPAVNLALFAFSAVVAALVIDAGASRFLQSFWYWMAFLNLLLFAFNMFPLPPFDGFTVAKGFVSFGDLEYTLRRSQFMNLVIAIVAFNVLGIGELLAFVVKFAIGTLVAVLGG